MVDSSSVRGTPRRRALVGLALFGVALASLVTIRDRARSLDRKDFGEQEAPRVLRVAECAQLSVEEGGARLLLVGPARAAVAVDGDGARAILVAGRLAAAAGTRRLVVSAGAGPSSRTVVIAPGESRVVTVAAPAGSFAAAPLDDAARAGLATTGLTFVPGCVPSATAWMDSTALPPSPPPAAPPRPAAREDDTPHGRMEGRRVIPPAPPALDETTADEAPPPVAAPAAP